MVYKQVWTEKSFESTNGTHTPVATLADEYGGRVQIAVDDHCYVLFAKVPDSDGAYVSVKHWFREAAEVLGKLVSKPKPWWKFW